MTRSGQEYKDSLRDGREIWIDGERVKDITRHPAFRNTVDSIAGLYDLSHDSAHSAVLTEGGVHRAFLIPRSYEDLVARRTAHKVWAEASFGYLGRTPDYMAAGIAGFAAAPGLFTTDTFDGAPNVAAYHRRMSEGDLYPTFTITNPQIDRTKSAAEQERDDLVVRVVAERDGGIVVRGAKMIGTAAVFGNEVLVGTIEPLAPQDVEHALCFSIPVDTPGLKFISRTSYEAQARSVFDNPLSSRFDENDALLVCEDVFVPWENVLAYRNVDVCFGQWWQTPAYVNFVHQAATRFWTKLEFLTGVAILLAKANNTYQLPPVQTQIGRLMGWVAQAKSMVLAAEAGYQQVDGGRGGVMPDKEISYAHRIMAGDLYPRAISEIKLLAGGGVIQLPASAQDLLHPEIGPVIAKYIRSPGHPAQDRVKLLKLAWDALGTEFAGRHEQYERFYHGAPHVYLLQQAWEGDTGACESLARTCLDGYELQPLPRA
ncbi:4-hydroxyphenylacetate 3-hydroxylase family protein [Streptomyces sp. RKAG337]|uniref:4-hydroxyphenylacetate 3-hydroxylase family protein n=1 Tax=Streptomyces sp. RKAG337 TaxID=2893404 RepID=UPI002033322D|nr:4-hydroxyphenylacetate 3-hydroxylase N-terminal domain-containing protein [Streptomyces sp. RKAG337]MCM2426046.1 4-hydroxyphenylacetate 3-monooxygenase [Streptomyces sp. RKAG337]